MEIRLKGGKPLMVGGGLIAGSQTCCCENPPPPPAGCSCGDLCQYFIEVVSPSEVAAKSLAAECLELNRSSESFADRDISWLDDVVIPNQFGDPTIDCGPIIGFSNESIRGYASSFLNSGSYSGLYAQTGTGAGYVTLPCGLPTLNISAGVSVRFSCSEISGQELSNPYIQIGLIVNARKVYQRFGGYAEGPTSDYRVERLLRVNPATECYRGNAMTCSPGGSKKVIQTPLLIEVTSTSTTLGAWQVSNNISGGPDAAMLETIVNQVLGKLTATFRITSRSSCRTVPADCDVPIDEGNTRVFWGGETPEFVLGTPESSVYTDPVTNDLLYYEHLAGGSGTIVYPYKFFFERTDNPPVNLLEQQYVDLYCESDNNVSPPVTAWYVVHETFKYCGAYTWDKWAGTIDTYGAPEDCGNISAGDPVPIGEPTMERIGGYPLYSSGGCGDPAPRIRFELEAPCGG